MARFYKTSSSMPLDYMYKLNTPLMERVVAANDDYITQNLNMAGKLGELATSFPFLQADEGRAGQIMNEYSKKIDDISTAIRQDPANWRKQLDPIRNVSRDLQQSYKVGEISKIVGNYSKYKNIADSIDKQVEEYNKTGKGISADRAKAYKQYFLNQFTTKDPRGTNYNPKTGEYNAINVYDPMGNIDIRKVLGDELDKLKADKTHYKKSEVTGEEWYFNDKTRTWEGITPEKILGIVTDRLNNPQLQDYLRQDTQVGLLKGVYDDDGKFIAPYEYKGVPISPEEQKNIESVKAQIARTKDKAIKGQLQAQLNSYEEGLKGRKSLEWNGQSYLAPIMRGLVNQYSYDQTSQEDLLRNNAQGQTKYTQGQINQRQVAQLQQQREIANMREAGINERFKQRLDFDKYKWDNPHATGSKGAGTGSKKVEKDLGPESTVSKFATNSFEDWTTETPNGKQVKVLSNEGLASDIDKFKKQEAGLVTKIKATQDAMKTILGNRKPEDLTPAEANAYNTLAVQNQTFNAQLPKVRSDLNARRKWYEGSVEAALSNNIAARKDKDGDVAKDLSPDEIKIYKSYSDDRDGMKMQARIAELEKKYPWIPDPNEGPAAKAKTGGTLIENPIVTAEKKKLQEYKDIKAKVDERRENFLAQIRYTPIDTDAIKLGKDDSKAIADMIVNNPQGTHIYDATGNKTDDVSLEGKGISWFAPKSDNFKMTTVSDAKNIFNYMKNHNVNFVVEQVGNTTKIGSGNAVAQVKFEDPNGEIPVGSFYIELSPELQKEIGSRLSKNKNSDVSSIAGTMLDDEANDLRRQLITPTIQRTAGATSTIDPVTFTIFVNNGNTKIPFQVTKFVNENGIDHINVTGSVNGVQVPLPGTASGIPGWFNGAEDFINYIKSQRK